MHDANGKLLFDGPHNTDADKASVPNDMRDFIETLDKQGATQKGNKIELKLGQ